MSRDKKTVSETKLTIMRLGEVGLMATDNSDEMSPLCALFQKIIDEASGLDD